MEDGYITQLEKLPPHARLKQPRALREEEEDTPLNISQDNSSLKIEPEKVKEVPKEVLDAMK